MGLRLVEHCQQVNVYGTVRTPGMLAEIRRAEELNIPVKATSQGLKRQRTVPGAARQIGGKMAEIKTVTIDELRQMNDQEGSSSRAAAGISRSGVWYQ